MPDISAAQRAKKDAALDKQVRVNGGDIMTRRALVERCIRSGYTVTERRGERVLMSPDGSWYDRENITKAGLDYAESLAASHALHA